MPTAAKQKPLSAYAALPRVYTKMNQNALLQKSIAVNAHGGVVPAFGADHFFSWCHGSLFLIESR
jgi:hypothetical protein